METFVGKVSVIAVFVVLEIEELMSTPPIDTVVVAIVKPYPLIVIVCP